MIPRTLFSPEHEQFRDAFRRFLDKHAAPHHADWEAQGHVARELWHQAGRDGFLCMTLPEAQGGAGADKLYSVVQMEEVSRTGLSGIGFGLHSEIVAPYIAHYGTPEQQKAYLPRLASGELVGAIAMTEPAAGSDLQGIRTTAVRDGEGYVINGSKIFITNGWHADLVIVVAKTDPARGAKGTSLFLVERGMPGFTRGQPLKKLGQKAQDTAELFFQDLRAGPQQLLGGPAQENRGFVMLMEQLPWERLQIAITAVAACEAALQWTVDYVQQRQAFGQAVAQFQNTRFKLAELQTQVQVARVFVDRCTELMLKDQLDTATASMAKYWTSDLQCQVMDECVQLFGGYGYMWEYPITRAYADARVQRIYGGTNEIMKEVISRSMGLGAR
jgi:alkylation response protein AidB-like acyl-CoA dehydrogenase